MSAVDVPITTGVDKRAEVVRGLRDLADFIESNEAVPLPTFVVASVYRSIMSEGAPLDVAALAAVGGKVAVKGDKVTTKRAFAGDVSLTVEAAAADICIPLQVTSTEFVLPEELRGSGSELSEADTTAVTW